MIPSHVAVFIDHKEARIFHIVPDKVDEATVTAPLHHIHRKHPKGPEGAKEHPDDIKRFFHDVAQLLEQASHILVVGPASAKLELVKYLQQHEPAIAARVVGTETVDHPTDGQLVAYAKKHFKMGAEV